MAPGRVTGGSRTFTKILLGVVAAVAALDLLLLGMGSAGPRSFHHLAIAAGFAAAAAAAWEAVARSVEGGRRVRPLAWAAFPVAVFLALGAVPFLVMSVHPPLEGILYPVEARVVEPLAIEVSFPRPVLPGTINLSLDASIVSSGYVARNPGVFAWRTPQRLTIDLARIVADMSIRRPRELGINTSTVKNAPRMLYETGDPVPEQRIQLR
ncbi:MAG TPA: hypothetical protein VMT52_18395 [Planctomycetota bacterium]|nr:hypothetical protein [Planctomycetota bacterium]